MLRADVCQSAVEDHAVIVPLVRSEPGEIYDPVLSATVDVRPRTEGQSASSGNWGA